MRATEIRAEGRAAFPDTHYALQQARESDQTTLREFKARVAKADARSRSYRRLTSQDPRRKRE